MIFFILMQIPFIRPVWGADRTSTRHRDEQEVPFLLLKPYSICIFWHCISNSLPFRRAVGVCWVFCGCWLTA